MRGDVVLDSYLEFGFQQIVPKNSGNESWVEMLFRPTGKVCNALETFFDAMNDSEKVSFDISALDYVCNLPSTKLSHRISINVSPKSLNSNVFLQKLNKLFNLKKLNPNQICLEVVESSKLEKISDYCLYTLKNFRLLGGWLALDDFGTGYAHWELLERDLVDVIKVVNNNIRTESISDTFLTGIAEFAKHQGITTVLEGVETEQEFEKGIELGFDYFQGYLFN